MDAQKDLQRKRRVVSVATAVLVIVILIGLWQAYGSWLMTAAGGHGS